jgi:hypothetical protein
VKREDHDGGDEAGFARRDEDRQLQLAVGKHELTEIGRQIRSAELQRDIADRERTSHERTRDQNAEIRDFYQDRFTSVGLFASQTATLQELHRSAFGFAYALARMAEHAYRFERDDDRAPSPLRTPGAYWDPKRAGLLAGMQLAADLQALHRRFVEIDRRQIEITQSFPLPKSPRARCWR